jgi:hypothetical protein
MRLKKDLVESDRLLFPVAIAGLVGRLDAFFRS